MKSIDKYLFFFFFSYIVKYLILHVMPDHMISYGIVDNDECHKINLILAKHTNRSLKTMNKIQSIYWPLWATT